VEFYYFKREFLVATRCLPLYIDSANRESHQARVRMTYPSHAKMLEPREIRLPRRAAKTLAFLFALLILTALFVLTSPITDQATLAVPHVASSSDIDPQIKGHPVPVDLFVMSKCPDAVLCENVFSSVLSRTTVPTNLTLSYIGRLDNSAHFGVRCPHDHKECVGNVQQLCFRHVYQEAPKAWFSFVLCLNRDWRMIGENGYAETCAKEVGYRFELVNKCVKDGTGRDLLIRSVKESERQRVRRSCTIFINGKKRCVHDGAWKDCEGGHEVEDFVRTIEKEYEK